MISDSSSDEDSSGDDENELILDHVWGELDVDAPRTEDSTRRLAACNMDWDRIRAIDIMVLCHSFLPPGGVVQKVSVRSLILIKPPIFNQIYGKILLTLPTDTKYLEINIFSLFNRYIHLNLGKNA